jgi:soluble lytic murein transglycosylase-like protein
MAGYHHRPVLSALALAATAGFATYASDARADVFEVGNDGQWRQINEVAADPLDSLMPSGQIGQDRLPPVRLAAITTPADSLDTAPAMALPARTVSGYYAPLINAAAQQYGISPALVEAVMWQESRYNQRAVSSAGAIGLMQLMPGTARSLGVNPHDPWQNVFGGAAYLRMQLDRFGNNVPLALAAYNAGPEAVARHGGIPPYAETRNYVRVIMRRLMSQGQ